MTIGVDREGGVCALQVPDTGEGQVCLQQEVGAGSPAVGINPPPGDRTTE